MASSPTRVKAFHQTTGFPRLGNRQKALTHHHRFAVQMRAYNTALCACQSVVKRTKDPKNTVNLS